MPLRNYTSEVPIANSIARIEAYLAQAGAGHVAKSYLDGKVSGLFFQMEVNGIPMTFKLPVRVEACFKVLLSERDSLRIPPKNPSEYGNQRREAALQKLREQADRTAWRILEDWVSVNVSLIKIEQAEAVEVFLPYAYSPEKDRTLFESMKETKFKALLPSAAGR